jgi:hypothetical protein
MPRRLQTVLLSLCSKFVVNVVFVLSVVWRLLRDVDWHKLFGLAQRMRRHVVAPWASHAGACGCCMRRGAAAPNKQSLSV